MTLTGNQVRDAITAWAESKVDAEIAGQIASNKEYNLKYEDGTYEKTRYYRPQKVNVEDFDRDDVLHELIEEDFYGSAYGEFSVDIPELGTVRLVDSYGGEGQGEDYWKVFEIQGLYYKFDHYYTSYESTPWHDECTIFPVVGKEVTVTKWVKP